MAFPACIVARCVCKCGPKNGKCVGDRIPEGTARGNYIDVDDGEVEFETTPDDVIGLTFTRSGLPVQNKQESTVFFYKTIPTPR